MAVSPRSTPMAPWRIRLHAILFETDTPAGKWFDIVLLWLILGNIVAVMADSVEAINSEWGPLLALLEWAVTLVFTTEYVLRLLCVRQPLRYALSFYGLVDLLAIIPSYAALFFGGSQSLSVIRSLRLLRVFRVLKFFKYVQEANVLAAALARSSRKITVFLGCLLSVAVIMGSLMYWVEGPEGGFTSIPRGVYWAIVTMTTVGYGDIHPETAIGQTLAATVMILGYAVIAVPTGIVSSELAGGRRRRDLPQTCRSCSAEGHQHGAEFCFRCGTSLSRPSQEHEEHQA